MNSPQFFSRVFRFLILLAACALCVAAAENGRLAGQIEQGRLKLVFGSVAGWTYHIETSTDLRGWEEISSVPAVSASTEFLVNIAGTGGFYRLRLQAPVIVPNPVNAFVQIRGDLEARAEIGPEGGTLSMTHAGVAYTLVIPPGALLTEQEITMAPLASVGGLPFDATLRAGAHFTPERLQLLRPATFEMRFAEAVAPTSVAGFRFENLGDEFHLYPDEIEGQVIRQRILHFSGSAVTTATEADREHMTGRPPSSAEAQADQQVRQVIDDLRERGGDAFTDQDTAAVGDATQSWWENSVAQATYDAAQSDSNMISALREFISWLHMVDFFGNTDRFLVERQRGMNNLARGLRAAFQRADTRCQSGDITGARDMLRWAFVAAMLGFERDDVGFELSDALDKINACLRLEIEFRSTIRSTGEGWEGISIAQATVPMQFTLLGYVRWTGTAPLRYTGYSVSVPAPCSASPSKTDSVFDAELLINLNIRSNRPQDFQRGTDLQLRYFHGNPTDSFVITCPLVPPISGQPNHWTGFYNMFHIPDIHGNGAGFTVRSWIDGVAPVVVERRYNGTASEDGLNITEQTSFILNKL